VTITATTTTAYVTLTWQAATATSWSPTPSPSTPTVPQTGPPTSVRSPASATPDEMITRLETLDRARQGAINAIKRHIEERRVPEVDLDTEEPTGEAVPW